MTGRRRQAFCSSSFRSSRTLFILIVQVYPPTLIMSASGRIDRSFHTASSSRMSGRVHDRSKLINRDIGNAVQVKVAVLGVVHRGVVIALVLSIIRLVI